jgi:hypothetical protein
MPRPPRRKIADDVDRVTQRGLERREIVRNAPNRQGRFRLFDRHATRSGWRVFARAQRGSPDPAAALGVALPTTPQRSAWVSRPRRLVVPN